jgi:pimeloyl-ACP methyl ester carboxylesterase
MKKINYGLLAIGILLVSLSVWQIQLAFRGIEIIRLSPGNLPVTVFLSRGNDQGSRSTILVGHGFAGSSVIMHGFALTLAHAGYNVVAWDFDGHGANPNSLGSSMQRDELVQNAEQALEEAVRQRLVSGERVAILGHSIGSGVALAYGQLHPETAATLAVSPVSWEVSPNLPRNLLLMAGTQEPSFLDTARRLLAQAGGESNDFDQGLARRLIPIPQANHLTILFSGTAQKSALDWVNSVFGEQPGAVPYIDRRILWFFLGVVGTLVGAVGLAGIIQKDLPYIPPQRLVWIRLAAMTAGVFAATLILWLLSSLGLEFISVFGLRVGGYLMVWFAIAGTTSLVVLRVWPVDLSLRYLLGGILTFAALWLGIGLLGHLVWQPWLMILPRLVLWPLAIVCLLPWFLVVGELVRGAGWLGQIAAWMAHSALLLGGLFLAMRLNPGIGFLILIIPVFPVFFGLHALASAPYRGGWPFALSGALFTSWMLLVVFPLG